MSAPRQSRETETPAGMRRPWQARLRLALSVIGPLAVALIALGVFRLTNDEFDIGLVAAVGNGATGLLDPSADGYWELLAAERRARLFWGTSIMCLVVAAAVAIVVSLWIIAVSLAGRARRNLLLGLAGMAAAMVGLTWGNDVSLEFTRRVILEPTVGHALNLTDSGFTLDLFELSRKVTNGLSSAATVAIVFAIIAAAQLQHVPGEAAGLEQRARHLGGQVRCLHVLLYAAAALLITVVLSMAAWLLWPVALADTPEIKSRLVDIVSGVGFFWGTSFTLLLAAAYVPSAMWLNARIRSLQATADDQQPPTSAGDSRREALDRFGLNQSVFSQVGRLVAILSPMITGILPFVDSLI
jgi:hypothetical protein